MCLSRFLPIIPVLLISKTHFSQAGEQQQSHKCVPTCFMKTKKHTQKDTQVAPCCGTPNSPRSVLDRRLCEGEKDARNVPCMGKVCNGISTLPVLRNPTVRCKSLEYQALLALLGRYLLLALSLQSPLACLWPECCPAGDFIETKHTFHTEWAGKFHQLLIKTFTVCSREASEIHHHPLEVHKV